MRHVCARYIVLGGIFRLCAIRLGWDIFQASRSLVSMVASLLWSCFVTASWRFGESSRGGFSSAMFSDCLFMSPSQSLHHLVHAVCVIHDYCALESSMSLSCRVFSVHSAVCSIYCVLCSMPPLLLYMCLVLAHCANPCISKHRPSDFGLSIRVVALFLSSPSLLQG